MDVACEKGYSMGAKSIRAAKCAGGRWHSCTGYYFFCHQVLFFQVQILTVQVTGYYFLFQKDVHDIH